MDPLELLTIPQTADLLNISRSGAYQMAASGVLPTVRLGRALRVRRAALARWLDEREANLVEDTAESGDPRTLRTW